MSSQRITFLLCLLVSAALHAALLVTLTRYVNRQVTAEPKHTAVAYRVAVPEPPPPPPDLFGEKNPKGDAINSSPGDEAQTSPLSRPDQAALTRDPVGRGPTASPAAASPPPSPPLPLNRPVTAPPPAAVPTPPRSPAPAFRKPNKPTQVPPETPPKSQAKEALEPPITKTMAKASPPTPTSRDAAPPTPPPTPPRDATPPAPAGGRPMPPSDRDSDPFAKEISVEFKRGRIAARSGREVKFARPRENLSAMVEAAEIAFPLRLRLKVAVGTDGRVRRADIVRSSGSPSIDRAFLLATYESWFEPAKDPQGRPVSDEVEFNIVLE